MNSGEIKLETTINPAFYNVLEIMQSTALNVFNFQNRTVTAQTRSPVGIEIQLTFAHERQKTCGLIDMLLSCSQPKCHSIHG